MSDACPCCVSTSLLLTALAGFIAIQVTRRVIDCFVSPSSTLGKCCRAGTAVCNVLVVLLAIALGALNSSPSLRSLVFYKFAMKVLAGDHSAVDTPRCAHLAGLSGRVLEIGPGPGTNFRCWSENRDIVEWVGVEPNKNFDEQLESERQRRNLTFPISTIWLNGEDDLDIAPQSFDYVVGTHVLCSVTDVYKVLQQVRRALKPGGEYVFMEHVVAKKGEEPFTYYGQLLIQPFVNIIGNGCLFKDTWRVLDAETGLPGFSVALEHRHLDMPISLFSPHIFGRAQKKLQ